MNVWINSFFIDYYDHWFDSPYQEDSLEWQRFGNLPPYKDEAFQIMKDKGLKTPKFGSIRDMYDMGFEDDDVVVWYWDITGHCTYGKTLYFLNQLSGISQDDFVSEFIDTDGSPTSTRILHVGEASYEFVMWSDHKWMSNTGRTIDIELVKIGGHERHFGYPLYAVDYVLDYAIDLNRCPGLKYTPIEDVLSSRDCAELIKEWFDIYDADGNERVYAE